MRGNGEVEFISETNNRLSLRVEAKTESILVLSDTYYPGWKVFVDGRKERILRANYNFRAVPLSKGIHQVEFRYDPVSFKLGAGLSIIGVISCIIIGWSSRRRKNQPNQSEMTMDIERTNTITLSILEKATSYHRWIFEKIKPYLKGNILEVGCGTGNLTGWLLRLGKVVVSDMNEDYLQLVEEKYRDHPNLKGVFIRDIQQEPSKELLASFDTIVCSNVLEHIGDDVSVLRHFHQLLSGEGRLILVSSGIEMSSTINSIKISAISGVTARRS